MKDERILALIDLQSVVTQKYTLYRNHEAIPDRLDQLRTEIQKAEEVLTTTRKAVEENQAQISRFHKETQQTNEKLTSLQAKLNQVKTTKEYEARQKEIKAQRERLSELDKAIQEAESKTAELTVVAEKAEQDLNSAKERVQPEIKELEAASVLYEQELGQIAEQERARRENIPGEILQRIDRLVLLRSGMAVVPVSDDCCGGCGVHLSPQVIQLAKRGLDLIQCDRCSSYIYWDDEQS